MFHLSGRLFIKEKEKQIKFNAAVINPSKIVKYLGLTLANKMNFNPHIKNCRRQGLQAHATMRAIFYTENRRNKIKIPSTNPSSEPKLLTGINYTTQHSTSNHWKNRNIHDPIQTLER